MKLFQKIANFDTSLMLVCTFYLRALTARELPPEMFRMKISCCDGRRGGTAGPDPRTCFQLLVR